MQSCNSLCVHVRACVAISPSLSLVLPPSLPPSIPLPPSASLFFARAHKHTHFRAYIRENGARARAQLKYHAAVDSKVSQGDVNDQDLTDYFASLLQKPTPSSDRKKLAAKKDSE